MGADFGKEIRSVWVSSTLDPPPCPSKGVFRSPSTTTGIRSGSAELIWSASDIFATVVDLLVEVRQNFLCEDSRMSTGGLIYEHSAGFQLHLAVLPSASYDRSRIMA